MKMEVEVETVFILNLIENVKKRKCLYDKRSAFYFNKKVKEKTWKEIAELCNRSEADCKHRWKLLRERFGKQLKKMEARSVGGICYLEEWRFMQPMWFLKGFLAPRRTRKNINLKDTETVSDQSILSGDSLLDPLTSSPTSPNDSMPTLDSLCHKFGESIETLEKNVSDQIEQETAGSKPTLDSLCHKFGETIENVEKSFSDPIEQETTESKPTLDSLCQKFGETVENIEKNSSDPTEQETTDHVFMQMVVCLMKDLPANIKDDFQAGIMQELYRLRKSCRNGYM